MNERSTITQSATSAMTAGQRRSRRIPPVLLAALLLTLPWPRAAWPLDTDYSPRDRNLDLEQQTRQKTGEQSGLQTERRQEQDAKNLEAYPRDRVLETRQQLQQQLLEQRRLTAEKRQEQQVNRQDAFPRDKTIELRQQLQQQLRDQRQLSTERRNEREANLPPPAPKTDVDYDTPR